jgi:hypothetical protein
MAALGSGEICVPGATAAARTEWRGLGSPQAWRAANDDGRLATWECGREVLAHEREAGQPPLVPQSDAFELTARGSAGGAAGQAGAGVKPKCPWVSVTAYQLYPLL